MPSRKKLKQKIKIKAKRTVKNTGISQYKLTVVRKKKARIAFYLSKGLSLEDSKVLSKVTNEELGYMRSDPEFEGFIQRSTLNYERELLEYIEDAAKNGTWQAASWILERKFSDKYGKKDKVSHEHTIKLQAFQKLVLDVINEVDPRIKQEIVHRLRGVNTKAVANEVRLLDQPKVIDAEFED